MNIFQKLYDQGIIKFSNLLISYQKKIGLTFDQTFLFIKILEFKNKYYYFDIQTFKKQLENTFNESQIDETLSKLYELKLIEVEIKDSKMIISEEPFIKQMSMRLSNIEKNWTIDEKIDWMFFNFDIPIELDLDFIKQIINSNIELIQKQYQESNSIDLSFSRLIESIKIPISSKNTLSNSREITNKKSKENFASPKINNNLKAKTSSYHKEENINSKLIQKNWFEE